MKLLALLSALLATGCMIGAADEGPGDPGGDPDPDGDGIQPVPTNGLLFDAALAQQLPAGALGARRADGAIELAAPAAFASPAGRSLLEYAAICALPAGETLAVGDERFPGYYGLAPEWATESCGASCQRWVSACLLAHANGNGTPVEISLRGGHAAFDAPADAAFTQQEAAFYGNVFERQLFACIGTGSPSLPTAGAAKLFLEGRVCGQVYGGCGLVGTGYCQQASVLAACKQAAPAGGGFADCHTDPMLDDIGLERTSPVIHEVVTVYLKP